MPTGSQDKLAHCRGVRRMHLNSNMSACEQALVSQFGSSAHGSLLRANFQSSGEPKSTYEFEVGGIDFYDYQICRREKFYRIATVL